ncbi:ABC transporter ATP-binding protein [Paraburkholderia sp. ZP32-5]|uniref:ABC transporter ATP-binding protein n=1 Tax=Paraburkholderia sp. ZP32-5 TaxID=2883245 RepID=UPI002DD43487|nr:ABC transporter ATP-binding protein [Paraburkholderia sp. ZP32-5]
MSGVDRSFQIPDGTLVQTLSNFNLSVAPGEFVAIVGPTGCGKSTTLNLITGLARPDAGRVKVLGRPVDGIDPDVGFVFQVDALFPWRSVLGNVSAGLRYRGVSKKEANEAALDWIAKVGLKRFANHYPHQLSGGMRKRVALAQTFISQPKILLMDEPFSSLDVQTRTFMQDELLNLWSSLGASVVFVTHDLEEAVALADRVVVLTARPATVKSSYRIDLPRPRVMGDIRYDARFMEMCRTIWADLKDEAQAGMDGSTVSADPHAALTPNS